MNAKLKISIAGAGYVGLSSAILLSHYHDVTVIDENPLCVASINSKKSPIFDFKIEDYLANRSLFLHATLDPQLAYSQADFIIVTTPTKYHVSTDQYDTSAVDTVLRLVQAINPAAMVVIKSTVPVGYTGRMSDKLRNHNILYSPEFLRKDRALYDNLHPSCIIVGEDSARALQFAELIRGSTIKQDARILLTQAIVAEATKLFFEDLPLHAQSIFQRPGFLYSGT